jgi:enoyl-CoA hydratase
MRIERKGDVAVIHMQAGRANAMNAAFLQSLSRLLGEALESRAVVITGTGNFFSGGLDLPAIIDFSRDDFRAFMGQFEQTLLQAFELPVPLVAAVNGHAVAGGCVLMLQADLRVCTDKDSVRIGLNETQLGLGLPAVVIEPLRSQVPPWALARIALSGELFAPQDALALRLVHEVVPDGELLQRAVVRAAALGALPPAGVRNVKDSLRAGVAAAVRARSGEDGERWLDTWFAPDTQRVLRATVAKLKSKG